ncbi:3'-to-5' exoribonuclease [Tetragenococcus muriaticus PMC-11-5]|uniref:3'-to-5' exoribonuclease n=1 Tax=Tetragenococcus muriaticus PMC-11-5 TaxID=1302649 RepID=A0A091C6T9_9ENTE|nr:3'-to-5' exoribonuclease [Tetragenococcus muriaticus PMC-11-5]
MAKNGKTFLAFTFQDTSGSIDGKFWDASNEEIQRFEAGRVVHLTGKREVYQGNPQMKIYKLRLTNPEEPNDPQLFMERAPIKREAMEEELNQVLFEITNPHWNRIVRFLLNKYKQEFFEYPAAKKEPSCICWGVSLSHHNDVTPR